MSKHLTQIVGLLEIREYVNELIAREARRGGQGKRQSVIVEDRLFSSYTDAAYWLARHRPVFWQDMKAAKDRDAHRVIRNLISLVRNRVQAYSVYGEKGIVWDGWHLAEDGAPDTWEVAPGKNGEDKWLKADLRRIK
jgi:hypothetical protein